MKSATIIPKHTIFDLSIDHFDKVFAFNLKGTALPSIIMEKVMIQKGLRHRCFLYAALYAITRLLGYSAAKTAIDNFTKLMAVEMAHKFGEGSFYHIFFYWCRNYP